MMTKSVNNSGYQVPTAATSFLYSDPGATVWFSVEGADAGDIIEVDWYAPGGTHYGGTDFLGPLSSGGSWCFSNTLNISGNQTANDGGDWMVVVTWNGARFFTLPFTIVSVPAGYYDGNWSGTTSQGLPMSMTVAGDEVTSYSVTETGGAVYTMPVDEWPIPICGNSFSNQYFASVFGGPFSGTFQSSTQASGSLVSGAGTVTWTATKQ